MLEENAMLTRGTESLDGSAGQPALAWLAADAVVALRRREDAAS